MNDRRCVKELVGLGMMNGIADAPTGVFFSERLGKSGVIKGPKPVAIERGNPSVTDVECCRAAAY